MGPIFIFHCHNFTHFKRKSLNPIHLRNASLKKIRTYFQNQNVEEVISPLMVKTGGIEPFVDPIALEEEVYLPTSPEISLKKIFALQEKSCSGIYEIAHAFRNDLTGKLHAREFTMVEWYRQDYHYMDLVKDVTELITVIDDGEVCERAKVSYKNYPIISVADLLEKHLGVRPGAKWGYKEYSQLALSTNIIHSESEPDSVAGKAINLMEIFTLLYDYSVLEFGKSASGIFFIKDYPEFLRGMAKLSNDGWAMRVEAYCNNLELCSGYQELDNADELRHIWEVNNVIREYAGKKIHPIDCDLISLTEHMHGVSGMALGLERTLMALYGINDIREFSL